MKSKIQEHNRIKELTDFLFEKYNYLDNISSFNLNENSVIVSDKFECKFFIREFKNINNLSNYPVLFELNKNKVFELGFDFNDHYTINDYDNINKFIKTFIVYIIGIISKIEKKDKSVFIIDYNKFNLNVNYIEYYNIIISKNLPNNFRIHEGLYNNKRILLIQKLR
jgi:hypothetical protein